MLNVWRRHLLLFSYFWCSGYFYAQSYVNHYHWQTTLQNGFSTRNILIRVFGGIVRALKKMVDGEHTEHWMDPGMSFSCLKMSSVCSGTSCLLRSLQPRMASSEVGELRERSRTRRSLVELTIDYSQRG